MMPKWESMQKEKRVDPQKHFATANSELAKLALHAGDKWTAALFDTKWP